MVGKGIINMLNNMHLEEIRLSRALMQAIEEEIASYGQVIPHSVNVAYMRLKEHYQREIEEGVM
jgi:hypothetical protein